MLGLPELADYEAARAALSARPGAFASVLFAEAANSDDVIDLESARDYLDERLAFLAPVLTEDGVAAIRKEFETQLRSWE